MNSWPHGARLALAGVVSALLLLFIGAVFWYQDWQYSRPTPRPRGLEQPSLGSRLDLPVELDALRASGKPLFLHFYSPTCPCSKFNLDHVRALIQHFGDRVQFAAVIESDLPDQARRAFRSLDMKIPAIVDSVENAAKRYGVYSTPQAVLIDAGGRLFYRGNYNTSRYCTDPATEFARIALEGLLTGRDHPNFGELASVAYGCPLPKLRRAALVELR